MTRRQARRSEPVRRTACGGRLLLAVLLLAAAILTACTGPSPTKSLDGPTEESSSPGGTGIVAAPGIYDLTRGRVEAVGTLAHLDLEGGFWAVMNVSEDDQSSSGETAGVIAVIPNAEDIRPDIDSLLGEYVAVRGKMVEGPSIRMAGAEIEADTIEVVGGDTAE